MSFYSVPLKFVSPGNSVYLRELTGHDELSVTNTGTVGAIRLLDRLLVDGHNSSYTPGMAEEIATADRDWLLAETYKRTYGTKIESTISCTECDSLIDLNFDLDQLLAFIQSEDSEKQPKYVDEDIFELEDGCRFRLPRGSDEFAIIGLPPEEAESKLMERCLVQASPNEKTQERLKSAMEQVAPIIETELKVRCPDCSKQQTIFFDIQSFLLSALMSDRKRIGIEVHRLAMAYHWSHDEILSLPRSLRRLYLSYIFAEMGLD